MEKLGWSLKTCSHTVDFRMVAQMANSKWQLWHHCMAHHGAIIVGDWSVMIVVARMPVAFSEDLWWRIVWHHLYKEVVHRTLWKRCVSERTVRRIVTQFLLTRYVTSRPTVGRLRFLNIQKTVILETWDLLGRDSEVPWRKSRRSDIHSYDFQSSTAARRLTRWKIWHIVLSWSDAQSALLWTDTICRRFLLHVAGWNWCWSPR